MFFTPLAQTKLNLNQIKQNLSQDLLKLLEWFHENCMSLNPEKCHYMRLGKDSEGDFFFFFYIYTI